MLKKMFKVTVIAMLALSLAACSNAPSKDAYNLKVWGSQDDQAFLQERVDAFKAANPDSEYNITLGVVGEPDAQDRVIADLDDAADVFGFPNDQITALIDAKALYEITLNLAEIKEATQSGAMDAVTVDGSVYAIPYAADNGYFMYYDSTYFTEEDVLSLDAMVAKADAAGKKIWFDLSNGWYIASFFLGAGLTLDVKDGKQVLNWNNETGVKVGEAIRSFAATDVQFSDAQDAVLEAGIRDGSIIAAVSGTWTADTMKEGFGDGYAATKLPEYTLDGSKTQLASFAGYKVYGVNSHTKHPEQAMALAEFLANEESQARRFELRGTGPANLKVAASDAVQANVALGALAKQAEFAHSQKNVLNSFWTPAEAFGAAMEAGSTENMQTLLNTMVDQIQQGE